ncbi:DEAD/DEAH box helicase [Shewanella sp. WXL01]|uniref:DEAD/DEAH box helicase n=1 Tax=Shewanella sp. WXL01 TaxID=2709721 RepID=UPI0014383204|nr:DEAD/DEAH box helicase [Shewanella sp. WXL01]NKF50120.1 DEAD/DEAH box helicase [Shewanella sp. WXL01]
MSFQSLPLSPTILKAIEEVGYQQPTPVQQRVIPVAVDGQDVLASAETGTGKTAAFALSTLQQLEVNDVAQQTELSHGRAVRVLVMTPTRELAIQIQQCFSDYGKHLPYRSLAVYGGASINPQRKALAQGIDILVATPGRLFDIVGQYQLDLSQVVHLVIDEADRMLDMGFVKDIEKVRRLVNLQHQTMMFSATYSQAVEQLAKNMLEQPALVNIKSEATTKQITHKAFKLDKRRKAELLSELIGKYNWQQSMVFVSSKESAEFLVSELKLDGISAAVFHGDKTQGARNRALDEFKAGKIRALIATDLAARGIDIEALPRVINFELPEELEDFVHRVGRTGRAGLSGEAMTFFSEQEKSKFAEIEALIEQTIPVVIPKGYEPGAPMPARYRELNLDSSAEGKRASGKSSSGKNGKFKGTKHTHGKKGKFASGNKTNRSGSAASNGKSGADSKGKSKPSRQGKYASNKG